MLDYVIQIGYYYVSSSQSLAASTSIITMFTQDQHPECPCGRTSPTYSTTPSSKLKLVSRIFRTVIVDYHVSMYRTAGGEPWCPANPGQPALYQCKPAIRCSPWFIELLYNPWWCTAADGSFGACCPDVYRTTGKPLIIRPFLIVACIHF